MPWDAFVSYASEDEEDIARPLVNSLTQKGLKIWFAPLILKPGDSLLSEIDQGLRESDYGIVILSPNFFKREWPQNELGGLVARETIKKKVVLPIWHNISKEEILKHSPILAGRKAAKSSEGLTCVVNHLLEVIRPELTESIERSKKPDDEDIWMKPLAPLTFRNLLSYYYSKDPQIDWSVQCPYTYNNLRILSINTMSQLQEAMDDVEAHKTLAELYNRLLGREPDWAGIILYQPWIFLEGARGEELVEQSILASVEYRRRKQ